MPGRSPLDPYATPSPGAHPDDAGQSHPDLAEPPVGYPADLPYPPPSAPATRFGHKPLPIPTDRVSEAESLRRIARALAAGTNSAGVLQVLCDAAMDQGRASGAMVAEVSSESGTCIAAEGVTGDLIGLRFPLAGSVTARVIQSRTPLAIATIEESSPFFEALLGKRGVGPALVVPLIAHEAFLGVLIVTRRNDTPGFADSASSRLAAVADLAALALWNARLLEESRAADAAKTSLLATLSHELRTPLAALEGYGELLDDEILGPLSGEQRDVLTSLRTVSRHLGALIEDILTFASLEADRVSLRTGAMAVEELLDTLHPFVEPLAREKGITVTIQADAGLPVLQTDEARVRQILLNLCTNAVKFTERGQVSVRASRGSPDALGASTVRFTVRDSGAGIASGDLARLFRPFSQLDDGPGRRQRGTGLGLYISRRLATILGGRIEVVSRPGVGSTFTLVLPVTH